MSPEEQTEAIPLEKIPPLDQIPNDPVKEMPPLKRKKRLDELPTTEPEGQPIAPWLHLGEGDSEICGMEHREVFASLELVNRACAEFNRQSELLSARKEEISAALKRLNTLSSLLNHYQVRLQAKAPRDPNEAIKRFQKQSQETRAKRKANALTFMGQGTSAKDVLQSLQTDNG